MKCFNLNYSSHFKKKPLLKSPIQEYIPVLGRGFCVTTPVLHGLILLYTYILVSSLMDNLYGLPFICLQNIPTNKLSMSSIHTFCILLDFLILGGRTRGLVNKYK